MKMNTTKVDNFHRNLTTILLSVIAIFGVYSLIVLNSVNKKLNDLAKDQAVQEKVIESLDKRLTKLEK